MRGQILLLLTLVALAQACSASSDVSRELGARCGDRDDCDDRCLAEERFPGGFCSLSCEDDGDCPGGASCVDLEGGVCMFDCEADAECDFLGNGWECSSEPAQGKGDQVMVCIGD